MKTNLFAGKTTKVMISVASLLLMMSSAALTSCGGDSSKSTDEEFTEIIENMVDSEKVYFNFDNYEPIDVDIQEYKSREAIEIDIPVIREWVAFDDKSNISAKNLKETSDSLNMSVLEADYTFEGKECEFIYIYNKGNKIALATTAPKDAMNIMIEATKETLGIKDGKREDLVALATSALFQTEAASAMDECVDIHTKDGKTYRCISSWSKK